MLCAPTFCASISSAAAAGAVPKLLAPKAPLGVWDVWPDAAVDVAGLYRCREGRRLKGDYQMFGGSFRSILLEHDPLYINYCGGTEALKDILFASVQEVVLRDHFMNGVERAVRRHCDSYIFNGVQGEQS